MMKLNEIPNFIQQLTIEIMYGTVSALPFPDNMFDFVTAFETYYFWPDLIPYDLKKGCNLIRDRLHYPL